MTALVLALLLSARPAAAFPWDVFDEIGKIKDRIGEQLEQDWDHWRGVEEIALDTDVVPAAHSRLPGYESGVEQCGEFVYRYFATEGHAWPDYPTLGQPAEYILTGDYEDSFPAFANPSPVRPRAGDILAAIGPDGSGEYHTALIWRVEPGAVWVYEANVPAGNDSPDWRHHVMRLPLIHRQDGRYEMPDLPTASLGYADDMRVAGWIHPVGDSRLPGAPE